MNTETTIPRFTGLHAELTGAVLHNFYSVYNELGGGFLESVYHEAMAIALSEAGMGVVSEAPIQVRFHGRTIGRFAADLVVNETVLLELKAVSCLDRAHEAQLYNYLRATSLEVGLLLNFGPRPAFKRIVLSSAEKQIRVHPRESAVGFQQGGAR